MSLRLASVLTKTGLAEASPDIEAARAALSGEMQKLVKDKTAEDDKVTKMESTAENVKNAQTVIGQENLEHMKQRFDSIDTESKGFLTSEEVKTLVKLTYVAPDHAISSFMNFFNADGKGITKDEFKHGLTLLYGDFSFALKAAPQDPLSPNAPSTPGSPISLANLGTVPELSSPGAAATASSLESPTSPASVAS